MKKQDSQDKEIAERVAKVLLDVRAVTLRPQKPFRFVSGILSPVYTDCRVLISCPQERKMVIDLFLKKISALNKDFEVVAGTATAGIPHAAWISDKLNLPMIYVRSKTKDHGKGNQIEGVIRKSQKAAVIEDLISTGESSAETVRAIREVGGKASYVFSIITYGMKKSEENFKLNKIKLISLTTFRTLVGVAAKNKLIEKSDQDVILEWINDPPTWGKRMGFE